MNQETLIPSALPGAMIAGLRSFRQFSGVGVVVLLMATHSSAQTKFPPLPDLTFASNGESRNAYLGDRWSYMAAGNIDAPAIVFLHGLGGNSMDWRFQFAGLADRFRVIAWNAPGYMLSDGFMTEKPGCREYADALADFLDALKLKQVNLVGNSNGSRVAQCFAIHYPARILKLAMVGPSAGRQAIPETEKAQVIAMRQAQIATGGYGFGARVEALFGPKTSPEIRELERNVIRATNPRALMHGVNLFLSDGYSPEELKAAIKSPILLIAGSADRVSPIETNAALIKKAVPNARLEILPDIGHLAFVEAPEQVNRLLARFFSN